MSDWTNVKILQSFQFKLRPTHPQDTQTCAELLMLDSTNVRILQASKNLRDIENYPWKLNEEANACCSQTTVQYVYETRRYQDFQFWKRKTIKTARQKCKVEIRLKIDIYTKIDKFLVVVLSYRYSIWHENYRLVSLQQRNKDIDRTEKQKQKPSSIPFFSRIAKRKSQSKEQRFKHWR